MWRTAARWLTMACGLSLAACLPSIQGPPSSLLPVASVSQAAQPEAALPSSTAATIRPTELLAAGPTFTPIATFTATALDIALSATPGDTRTPMPTETATALVSISLDKLPPGTVYKNVRIDNQSRAQTDISLHCTTVQGLQTVLEYNNVRHLTIRAPEGDYVVVVYTGGRPMVARFSLIRLPGVTITIYADRLAIH